MKPDSSSDPWCLVYVKGGKSRIPFHLVPEKDEDAPADAPPPPDRDWNEFIAAQEMQRHGLNAWCGRKIAFVRLGNQRKFEPKESPYLRNYVFVQFPVTRFHDLLGIKHVARTVHWLRRDDLALLEGFRAKVEAEYAEGQRVTKNREMIAGYKAGQALRHVDGRFGEQLLRFKRMVERAHDLFPRIEAEMEMMGRTVMVQMDPLDVRAAE